MRGHERGRSRRNGISDPMVVRTSLLADVVARWVRQHEQDHPSNIAKHGQAVSESHASSSIVYAESMPETHGVRYLAERLGVDQGTINRVLRKDTKWTTLGLADDLLTAMGQPQLLRTEITPVPNPHWSVEHWEAWHAEHGSCSS